MARARRRRQVFRIRYHRPWRCWALHVPGAGMKGIQQHPTRQHAVAVGRQICRTRRAAGEVTQLVIHGKDGRIQTESTYGRDPRRTKG